MRAVDEGWTVEAGGRQRLPQQSVSKLWVAFTLLDLRDQGKARLDQPPPGFERLSVDERRRLAALLRKALGE